MRDAREAEQLRYAQEKVNHYNFTKLFTPGHRDQNVRLLHSFLVVAEHLRVPQGGRVLDLGGGAPGSASGLANSDTARSRSTWPSRCCAWAATASAAST